LSVTVKQSVVGATAMRTSAVSMPAAVDEKERAPA
jgi:hypothetical protein